VAEPAVEASAEAEPAAEATAEAEHTTESAAELDVVAAHQAGEEAAAEEELAA
jgi:hypothetical protein